jgi:hypothetical protein
MNFYHRTNYDLIFNEYCASLVFVMMKVGMFFVMASVWRALFGERSHLL